MCVVETSTKKSSEGSEHATKPWQTNQTNFCCEHAHTYVLQKEAVEGCAKKSRVVRPIPAVGIHMCVSEYTHGVEQANGSFDHFKNDTHVLQKISTEGWPTNCCCEHTHVGCRIVQ